MFRVCLLLALVMGSSTVWAEAHLSAAWIRALPPSQPVTAAYVTIMNHGQQALTVTGARVEGAGRVEMHTSREVDGLVTMEQVEALALAPGETLSLEPGGVHLMLFELETMPGPGQSRELCLHLASGGEVCTTAQVRKSAGTSKHDHHQHH